MLANDVGFIISDLNYQINLLDDDINFDYSSVKDIKKFVKKVKNNYELDIIAELLIDFLLKIANNQA